ncbi:hypothetical protein DYH09_34050 [bacterium CPR1]|nr:hypothetical protein [bacterium CPR1]
MSDLTRRAVVVEVAGRRFSIREFTLAQLERYLEMIQGSVEEAFAWLLRRPLEGSPPSPAWVRDSLSPSELRALQALVAELHDLQPATPTENEGPGWATIIHPVAVAYGLDPLHVWRGWTLRQLQAVLVPIREAQWDESCFRLSLHGFKPPEKPAPAQRKLTKEEEQEAIARLKARMAGLGLNKKPVEPEAMKARLAEQGVQLDVIDPLKESRKGARG